MSDGTSPLIPRRGDPGYRAGTPIRDAASLVVVRFDGDPPRVLMGRRRRDLAFLPGRLVFPGGRVERGDFALENGGSLSATTERLLLERMRGRPSAGRARAIAFAAIRETFEETGMLIGRQSSPTGRAGARAWQAFLAHGMEPDAAHLHLLARSITPPGMARRFDTRFFVADAARIALAVAPPHSELEAADWLTFAAAGAEPLHPMTRTILELAESRLGDLAADRLNGARPFFKFHNGRRIIEMLGVRA